MKVMSRESENGEEGEISVVKEASHDVRNYVMKLWNGSSGRGIWRWPTFLSFAIDLDFDEQFPLLRKETRLPFFDRSGNSWRKQRWTGKNGPRVYCVKVVFAMKITSPRLSSSLLSRFHRRYLSRREDLSEEKEEEEEGQARSPVPLKGILSSSESTSLTLTLAMRCFFEKVGHRRFADRSID